MTTTVPFDTPSGFPYPVQIIEDRYGGSYCGGIWIAAVGYRSLFESLSQGGDSEAVNFFDGYAHYDADDIEARMGRGDRPDAALADLIHRWSSAGQPDKFDWDGDK